MKKATILIFFVTLTIALTLSVSARTYTASPYRDIINNYDAAYTALYEAINSGQSTVDITDLKINKSYFGMIYADILQSCPEFFFLDKNIKFYHTSAGLINYVTKVEFNYTMSDEERALAQKEYDSELAYIVSLVSEDFTDVEKALWVHDYMITAYEYDINEQIYDAYHLFKERKGVCQAYSLAYMAVLRELGIEVFMTTSKDMNHAWNLVNIDGEWYHVDLSFDDPMPDLLGRTIHEYFLLDDEAISNAETPHYGWQSRFKCKSLIFSDAFWKNVTSRIVYLDGLWYYIDNSTGTLYSAEIDDEYKTVPTRILDIRDKWRPADSPNEYWIGIYSGVSECIGHIFINTPTSIVTYNTKRGKINTFYESKSGQIYGSNIYKNSLEYQFADSPAADNSRIERFDIKDFYEPGLQSFPFKDVSRLDNSYASIRYVYSKGLFNGVSSDRFAPDSTLTRAMFVTVLGRLCEVNPELYPEVSFNDVKGGLWYSPYVEWASKSGIVNGVGNRKFDPIGEITREQMYKIIAVCGKILGLDVDEADDAVPQYADLMNISDWAHDGVAYCVKKGLISVGSAKEYLFPQKKATRAEAAVIIAGFAKLINAV